MSAPPNDHEQIKSYLLGQLAEEDASQFEARLLTDGSFYEELSIVEDELVDQYLAGDLSDSERRSFESHFISSPERKQKIRFARALRKHVSRSAETPAVVSNSFRKDVAPPSFFSLRRPLIAYAFVAAVVIIIGANVFLFLKSFKSRGGSGKVLAIELTPSATTRGSSEVKQFTLAPDIGLVRFQLDLLKNEYQSYEAVISDSSLRSVLTTKNLKPQTIENFAAIELNVKADLLSPGDYRIQLSGTRPDGRSETVATFAFTVGAK